MDVMKHEGICSAYPYRKLARVLLVLVANWYTASYAPSIVYYLLIESPVRDHF